MSTTTLEIPTELLEAANLTPQDAKKELAIRLYQLHKLNEKQAGELAGDPQLSEALTWRRERSARFDLDDFLSWASHDLKTPLNSIIGFSKVVLKGIDGPINETQEKDLTTVFTAGQRMLALISYLVEIARLNNGQTQLVREDANVAEIIAETGSRWKSQNPSKPLTVEINLADPILAVDKTQMRQIVSHLLSFASLRLTEGTVSLSASDANAEIRLRARSSGKKSADKFEMDSAMLGFLLSSLVNLHGGQMDTLQETGDGWLLTVTLPRKADM